MTIRADGEDHLITLVRSMPSAVAACALDAAGTLRLVDANAAAEACGLTPREAAVVTLWPGLPADALARWTALARVGGPSEAFHLATPMGEPATLVAFAGGKGRLGLLVARSDRDPLAHFLDAVVESMPAMVFVKDAKYLRFLRFNRAGEDLLGVSREALLGKTDHDLFPPEQARFFQAKDREVLTSGETTDIPEEPIDTPSGTRWLHTRKVPILGSNGHAEYLLGISMDVTERRQAQAALRDGQAELERRVAERTAELERANAELLREIGERHRAEVALLATEEQLRHAQKMEVVGRLAGGVAHDFNNLLSIVLGYSGMILDDLPHYHRLHLPLTEIHRAGERGADLTRQLLAFSRQQVLDPKVVDLNQALTGIERMVRRLVGEDVTVYTRLASALGRVRVDAGQLEQVVLNLVVNARDALPAGGQLTIETANATLDDDDARTHPGGVAGPQVLLTISDNGIGMDLVTQARAFEPFFTTKPDGKGTGLGLSTVFGIVKQSGGSIRLTSEPGQGTTFRIYFPRIDDEVQPLPAAPAHGRAGTETVLLVEDDAQVRDLAARTLEKYGYTVVEATPEEALRRAEDPSTKIDLLLTDVVMPSMSGRQLAERVLELRPLVRVLFMSGHTEDAVLRSAALSPRTAFLPKPLTVESLSRKVRELLDS